MADAVPTVARRRAHVLSIGDDLLLLQSRHMLLRSAGYEVISVPSHAFIEEDRAREFDLVLLCHSIGMRRSERLAKSLRELNPLLELLRIANFGSDGRDEVGTTPPDPGLLLYRVAQLTGPKEPVPGQIEEDRLNREHESLAFTSLLTTPFSKPSSPVIRTCLRF
jgi:hypothetical protein